jgi:CheY-like chemotaxis protein
MTRQARSLVDEPSAPIAPSEPTFTTAHRTALLVDDASDVVVTVGAFLESFGFQVLRANTGDHALEILATGAAVDLLVTDHAMPGMTGRDLAVQACQQRSALRALIITGYPDADDLAMLPERVLLLAKPFRRIELREKINALFGVGKVAELQKVDNAALRGL